MSLEIVYIVIALIIVSMLFLMAFLFKKKGKKHNLNTINKKDIVKYLLKNYPNINFDVSKLSKKEFEDKEKQKDIIVEDIARQFADIKVEFPNSAAMIEHEFIWDTYQINCKPAKGKIPPDLAKRRDALVFRDKHKCQRCSFDLDNHNMRIYFLKDIEDGGDYSFENMISVCNDCHKILHSKDINRTIQDLDLTDKLLTIA